MTTKKSCLSIIFISENSCLGNIVKSVTGSQWSHVGIIALGGIVEAVPPKVIISPQNRYDECKTEQIDFYVPDITATTEELKKLIGTPYGWLECIKGGLKDLASITFSMSANEKNVNCCELVVRTIRSGGGEIDSAIPDDCFTPQSLYTAIKMSVI
ncbi:MAG: hypothetical protein LBR56_00965 [Sporomusaceae bacterium]|jgi:hypothetical protein|nr:hypothetical protein [Sporomusaceae bacterium]